ncbi:MAG: heparinase II/III family protein [Fimbriimonadaceae bacterium]|nr:heparinase II/III family protein [Fimbriimonadaceae bacterium]
MAFDYAQVSQQREQYLAQAQRPRWAGWWNDFLAAQQALAAAPLDLALPRLALAGQAEPLALAAALTADPALGAAVAARLTVVLDDDSPWMDPGHQRHYSELHADLLLAELTKRLVTAGGWAAPWLSADLATRLAAAVRQRGGQVIADDAAHGAWWADGHNSNWCAVLQSGLGFAALYLNEPAWRQRATVAITGVLDLLAPEGAGLEGCSYWVYCARSCHDFAVALAGTGDRHLLDHPFWSRAIEFALHLTTPGVRGWANFGDCGYPGVGGSHLFYAIAALTGDGRAQWLGDQVSGGAGGWADFLFYDPTVVASAPSEQPGSRLFSSVHLASLRSGWEPEAVQLVLKGGSNAWSHCHLDLNSFILTAGGERLAVDPGPWPYTDDYWTSVEPPQSTAWHNTLTVDGGDQRQPPRYRLSTDLAAGGEAWCALDHWHQAGGLTVVRGDASSAYADTLDRFHRWVVHLAPATFLIFDDVRVREARTQRHLQWLLHTLLPQERTADGLLVRGQQAALHLSLLAPQPHGWKRLADRRTTGHAEGEVVHASAFRPAWHHIWNASPRRPPHPHWEPAGQPSLYGAAYPFVALLQVTAAAGEPTWRAEPVTGDGVVGARLQAPGDEVTVLLRHREGAVHAAGLTSSADLALLRRSAAGTQWLAAGGAVELPGRALGAARPGDVTSGWLG